MRLKYIASFLITFILILSLAACNKPDPDTEPAQTEEPSTETLTEAAVSTAEQPVEKHTYPPESKPELNRDGIDWEGYPPVIGNANKDDGWRGFVNAPSAKVRSSENESDDNNVVDVLKRGVALTVYGCDGYWYDVSYQNRLHEENAGLIRCEDVLICSVPGERKILGEGYVKSSMLRLRETPFPDLEYGGKTLTFLGKDEWFAYDAYDENWVHIYLNGYSGFVSTRYVVLDP